ncbi:XkdX family protein [Enterococcus faecalis]|nr:XkdX family protein [Enterococcus faecalis]
MYDWGLYTFDDVKLMYDWGLYTDDEVKLFVPTCITEEEFNEIVGKEG